MLYGKDVLCAAFARLFAVNVRAVLTLCDNESFLLSDPFASISAFASIFLEKSVKNTDFYELFHLSHFEAKSLSDITFLCVFY